LIALQLSARSGFGECDACHALRGGNAEWHSLAIKEWIMNSRKTSVLAGAAVLLSFAMMFSVIGFAQSEDMTAKYKAQPEFFGSNESSNPDPSMSSQRRPEPAAASGETGRIGLGVKFSSLGAGAEMAASITMHANARVGFNIFRYSRNFTKDSIPYNGQVIFQSIEALYDWFPFGGAFHLSPGVLAYNGNQVKATTSVAGGRTFTLGGTTYMSDPVNPVTGNGKTNFYRMAPMFVIGYGNLVPRSGKHFSVPVEAGLVFQGSPNVSLNLMGNVCNPTGGACRSVSDPVVQSQVQAEQKKINSDISFLEVYPVISVGFAFKF
jgi:hypothetical protein